MTEKRYDDVWTVHGFASIGLLREGGVIGFNSNDFLECFADLHFSSRRHWNYTKPKELLVPKEFLYE